MKYYGQFNGKEMVVYVAEDERDNEVSICTDGRSFDGIIKSDENGQFFVLKKSKIYLKDLETRSFDDLVKRAKNGEWVSYLEFLKAKGQEGEMNFSYSTMKEGSTCKIKQADEQKCPDKYQVECQEPNVNGTRNWDMTSFGIIEALRLGIIDMEPAVCV